MPRREASAEVPHARALDRPRGHHRGGARAGVPGPRDGRGARGRRPDPPARAERLRAAVGAREPALLQLVRPALAEGSERLPDLRASHGAVRGLTVRATLWTLVVLLGVTLAVAVAGCGQDKPTAHPAPLGGPVLLPPPGSTSAGDTSTTDTTDTTTDTTDTTSTTSTDAGTSTTDTPTGTTDTTSTTDTTDTGTSSGTPPGTPGGAAGSGGAGAGGEGAFCTNNPGAC